MNPTPEQTAPQSSEETNSGAQVAQELTSVQPASGETTPTENSPAPSPAEVDTSDPSYAINKFRQSGPPVTTDASGYGQRGEYPHNDLESAAARQNREAQYRQANGLPTAGEAPARKGLIDRLMFWKR